MASRTALRTLMTGAAIASLSTVAMADGWNSLIVFGGRDYDSGQFVSYESVFSDGTTSLGDGRQRATNTTTEGDGGRGAVASQRVSEGLGFGATNPSQPQSYAGAGTPPEGWNYAALFHSSRDILDSITGTSTTGGITFSKDETTATSIPGVSRPGLLVDGTRNGDAWGALVLVGSAQRDLRGVADIDVRFDGDVDFEDSFIARDEATAIDRGTLAATNIATGVDALAGAGAGLVVVSNAYDTGTIPEVGGDNGLLAEADAQLTERETEASTSAAAAHVAIAVASAATTDAKAAEAARATLAHEYTYATVDPAVDAAALAALLARLKAATTAAADAATNAVTLATAATDATAEAVRLALTPNEIARRPEIDAALADPDLIRDRRSAATAAYNAELLRRLRGVNADGNVLLVDQKALFDGVFADPARFGLSADVNQATSCASSTTLLPCNDVAVPVDQMLFLDGVQLTETGHQLVADQILSLLDAPATLSGIAAMGISSARGISDAGRDQVSREQTWKTGIAPFATGVASRVQLEGSDGFPQHDAGFYSGVAGVKYVVAPGLAVGAAAGYQKITGPGDNSSIEYDGGALLGTLFAGINTGPVFGSVTATYGKVDYDEVTRVSKIGAATIRNTGSTEGTVAGVTAEAGLRLVQYDILRGGPIANFSHWHSTVDGYAENGWAATSVSTGDLETTSTRAGVGVFMEAGMLMNGHGSLFRAKALYGHEFGDGTKSVSVTPNGPNSAGSFSAQGRGVDGAALEFGAEVVLGYGGFITTFGYDGILGDVSDHRFRIGASMPL